MRLVVQETAMGCAVASVANLLEISYSKALNLFDKPENQIFRGFFCKEIVSALKKQGLDYSFKKLNKNNKHLLLKERIIVFVKEGKDDIYGHYFAKNNTRWIDSWINWPSINPARAGTRKELPGKALWIIYPSK